MKLYKSLFIATALLGGMMTSCSEDGVWDQASPANLWLTNGTAYTFDNSTINYTFYPADVMKDMDVNVTVTRGTTEGTATINIESVFSDEELISGPTSVTFQDGSNTAVYPIHVKQEFEPGISATAKLVIDSASVGIPVVDKPKKLQPGATHEDSVKFLADSTAYAVYVSKLSLYKLATTVTVEKDFNWVSLGVGKYYDRFTWGSTYYEAEIQQAVEDNSWYRVVDPYTQALEDNEITVKDGPSKYVKFKLLKPGDEIRGVTVTKKDLVYFSDFKTGEYNNDYGDEIWCYHPSKLNKTSAESNWVYNYVSSYQKDGQPAQIYLSAWYYMPSVGGWNYTQNGYISIVFPGVKIYNYSAKIEYAGMFTNPSNVVFALANYELTGADAKKAEAYKVAVISQNDDADAVADAILAGEYPASDLEDVLKDERIQIEIPEGLTGKLQIILVIIDKNEEGTALEVKNVVAAPFEYYAGGNPWKSLGVGVYYDDFVVPFATNYQYGAWPVEVEIEEHSETPGLYRLKNAYSGVAAAFGVTGGEQDILIHAEDPSGVYFTTSPTGLDLGNGEYSIVSAGGDYVEYYSSYSPSAIIAALPQYFGKVANGVITLPVLTRTDSDGNPLYDGEGNPKVYQGYLYVGEDGYYACTNGGFKIILPSASASVKANAKRAMAASDFELRLNGGASSLKLKNKMPKVLRYKPLQMQMK